MNSEAKMNYSSTLNSNFSHCLQEDIPNSIEPVFNCFKKSLKQKENPDSENAPVRQTDEIEEKRQWVILEGQLQDKQGRVIMKYFNKIPSNSKKKFKENIHIPVIEGEPVVFYYGPEKNYGLII